MVSLANVAEGEYESLKFIWLTNLLSLKNNNYMNKFNSQFNIFIFSIENLSYIDFPFILSITLIHSFFNSHSNERAAARCSNVWLLLWALLYVFRYTFCQEQEMCIWSNNEQQWSVHFYTVTSCMCVCEYERFKESLCVCVSEMSSCTSVGVCVSISMYVERSSCQIHPLDSSDRPVGNSRRDTPALTHNP